MEGHLVTLPSDWAEPLKHVKHHLRVFCLARPPEVAILTQLMAELDEAIVPQVVGYLATAIVAQPVRQLPEQPLMVANDQFSHNRWPNCRATCATITVRMRSDRKQQTNTRPFVS
jgi:hypothetical protein